MAIVIKRKHGRPEKFTAEQQAQIVAQYLDGESIKQLALDWGATRSTIGNYLKRHNVYQEYTAY